MTNARAALQNFVKAQQRWPLLTGTVKALEGELCDVDPSDGGPTIYSVRIKPAVNDAAFGVIAYPKVGSACIIGEVDGDPNKYVLLQCERMDRMLVKTNGGSTIELKTGGIIAINGEDYKGLVKVQDLKTELAKVNAILQAIQQAFSAWVTVPNDGGAALKAISDSFTSLQRPTYNTIESAKTKHGSA